MGGDLEKWPKPSQKALPALVVVPPSNSLMGKNRQETNVVTELFKAKAVLFGSPTVNKGILAPLSGMLHEVKRSVLQEQKAAVFGTYGWSGESVDVLTKMVEDGRFRNSFSQD